MLGSKDLPYVFQVTWWPGSAGSSASSLLVPRRPLVLPWGLAHYFLFLTRSLSISPLPYGCCLAAKFSQDKSLGHGHWSPRRRVNFSILPKRSQSHSLQHGRDFTHTQLNQQEFLPLLPCIRWIFTQESIHTPEERAKSMSCSGQPNNLSKFDAEETRVWLEVTRFTKVGIKKHGERLKRV